VNVQIEASVSGDEVLFDENRDRSNSIDIGLAEPKGLY
jgi:hypothetical protein